MITSSLLVSVFCVAAIAADQSAGTFTATATMTVARANHTATLLLNGRVLIAGGAVTAFGGNFGAATASAEIYDPSTGYFAPTGNMTTPRIRHTATLLPDGRVLIAGGSYEHPASAELYDPSTGSFNPTSDMAVGGVGLATLLADGRVLVAHESAAELYDPITLRFTLAARYPQPAPGILGTITLLADSRVLLSGCPARCESGVSLIYDPGTDTFSPTGSRRAYDDVSTATLMMDGRVLFVGSAENDGFPSDAEIYDPSTGSFTSIGYAIGPHEFSAAMLLPDGTVLITGGQLPGGNGDVNSELYGPADAVFSGTGGMTTRRHEHKSTLLPDGEVLVTGGYSIWPNATAASEIYRPAAPKAAAALLSLSGDGMGQGAIQHANTYEIASESNPAAAGDALVIYCTGLADGSVIPPHVVIGGRMAEVLWFGNTPGFVGLKQVNVRVPGGVAPGSAVPVRLIYLDRPSNQVTIAVR